MAVFLCSCAYDTNGTHDWALVLVTGAPFRRGRPSGMREAKKAGKGAMHALKVRSNRCNLTARQSHQRVQMTMAKTWCPQNRTLMRRCDA